MNWKKLTWIFTASLLLGAEASHAQQLGDSPELMQIIKTAGNHLNSGQLDQAIALYKQAIHLAPDNIALRKDLAYSYFLKKDLSQARETITQVLNSPAADPQTFQIAASIEQADGKTAKAKKIVNNGLDKYPDAGVLYNTKGNILVGESKNNQYALKEWLKGIAVAPNYAANYFNAAKTLGQNGQLVWTITYGEKFINLEPQSAKAIDMRKIVFDAYKNVFQSKSQETIPDFQNAINQSEKKVKTFEEAFMQSLNNNISTIATGFNVENLTMLRVRFLIHWNNNFAEQFPQSLFTYQTRVMQAGHFSAYNQWLFGATESSEGFSNWLNQNKGSYQKFELWKQKNNWVPAYGDAALLLK